MDELTLWDHLFALGTALLLPLAGSLQQGAGGEPFQMSSREKIVAYWSNGAVVLVLAGVGVLVWRLGGRTLESLGLTAAPAEPRVGLAIAAAVGFAFIFDTLRQLHPRRLEKTRQRLRRRAPFMPANRREAAHSLVMVAGAAVGEEIVFRGFLVSYAAHFTGRGPLGLTAAVVAASLVFGLSHGYQGAAAAAKVTLLACGFGALFAVTGSLWMPIALHFAVDLVGVALSPRLLREAA